ncbi:MAG: 50S ribosomal protein L29 [Patescibacteria group bacterium]|nr:50S ribosomal protein L29 [Patescibacteria group bacterium]
MKFKELTTKPEAEVRQLLAELKAQAHDLMVKAKLNQLKNTNQIRAAKKDIARILTYLHSKSASGK